MQLTWSFLPEKCSGKQGPKQFWCGPCIADKILIASDVYGKSTIKDVLKLPKFVFRHKATILLRVLSNMYSFLIYGRRTKSKYYFFFFFFFREIWNSWKCVLLALHVNMQQLISVHSANSCFVNAFWDFNKNLIKCDSNIIKWFSIWDMRWGDIILGYVSYM